MSGFLRGVLAPAALASAAVLSWSGSAEASDFRVHRDWAFGRRIDDLVAIITDYADMCDHGCRYHAPTVTHSVVLGYQQKPDSFYVWTATKDIQNSAWFAHVTVQRGEGRAHVDFKMVPEDLAKTLEKLTGKENDPATDACTVSYELHEELDKDGRFLRTRVSFTTSVELGGIAAWIGGGIVRGRLEDAAHAVYLDLRDAKVPGAK
jgi:hypothetical protein